MNKTRSAFSLGSLILGLSLVSALCQADASQTAHAPDSPGSYSAAALYNLGNSYAREGKPALAVLNYERARLLAPLDPDIRANLQHVRDSASLRAPANGFWDHFRLMSPNATYWLGLTGLVVAGVCALLLVHKKSSRAISGSALGASLLMVAYTLSDAAATGHVMREAVVTQNASASASPIDNAEALFTLPPATLVQIQDKHGTFLLIRDAQGNVGWVPRNQIDPVIHLAEDVHA